MGANGQACINAKRFIVEEKVYNSFKEALIEHIKSKTVIGDPMKSETNLGPLALHRQMTKLKSQINQAI